MPGYCLIGGTNAVLWMKPAGGIIAAMEEDLGLLPYHRGIVITSVVSFMTPLCKPQTVCTVCEWVRQYPVQTN